MTAYSEEYLKGYKDGMDHIAAQVDYLNDQMARVTDVLRKAVFAIPATRRPKPGVRLWLVLDADSVTTGYYVGGNYISDGGSFVTPTHWCLIPAAITGEEPRSARRIVKRD